MIITNIGIIYGTIPLMNRYFHQLTHGCGAEKCSNPNCKRNSVINDTDAAKLSLEYAKKAFDKTNPQFFLCDTVNPYLPNFSPTLGTYHHTFLIISNIYNVVWNIDLCVQEECLQRVLEDNTKTGDYSIFVDLIKRVFCNETSLSYSFQTKNTLYKNNSKEKNEIDNSSVDRVYKLIFGTVSKLIISSSNYSITLF